MNTINCSSIPSNQNTAAASPDLDCLLLNLLNPLSSSVVLSIPLTARLCLLDDASALIWALVSRMFAELDMADGNPRDSSEKEFVTL